MFRILDFYVFVLLLLKVIRVFVHKRDPDITNVVVFFIRLLDPKEILFVLCMLLTQ